MLLSWLACAEGPLPPTVRPGPELSEPDPALPLVRELSWPSIPPTRAMVQWTDGEHAATREGLLGGDATLPLLRMSPDREVRVTVRLEGAARPERLSFTTPPLPEPFPDIEVLASEPERTEPGDTLLGVASPDATAWQVVLDPSGRVVWLWRLDPRVLELQLGPDGWLFGNQAHVGMFEVDWAGHVRRRFRPARLAEAGDVAIDVPQLHHEAQRLSDGLLVGLTKETVWVEDFPASTVDPEATADAAVRVDVAVLIDPVDGAIRSRLVASDALPLSRVGYLSLNGPPYDWSHANGVAPSPDERAFVVSYRHQDALVAFERDGRPRWILANPDHWTPEAEALRLQPVGEPFDWPFAQHAPEWSEGGRILVFDNGNFRASPWTGAPPLSDAETWSRIVEFEVDEERRTVALAWAFELPGERVFSSAMGDADHLPNGHVLGNFAAIAWVDGAPLAELGLGRTMIRLVELVPGTGEVVWDVRLSSPRAAVPEGWNSFRAQRLPPGWETAPAAEG